MGNQLPGAVSSDIIREHMEVTDQLDEILKKWKKFSLPLDGKMAISMTAADSVAAQTPGFLISNELALLFAKLVSEHTKVEGRRRYNAEKLFVAVQAEKRELPQVRPEAINQWLTR